MRFEGKGQGWEAEIADPPDRHAGLLHRLPPHRRPPTVSPGSTKAREQRVHPFRPSTLSGARSAPARPPRPDMENEHNDDRDLFLENGSRRRRGNRAASRPEMTISLAAPQRAQKLVRGVPGREPLWPPRSIAGLPRRRAPPAIDRRSINLTNASRPRPPALPIRVGAALAERTAPAPCQRRRPRKTTRVDFAAIVERPPRRAAGAPLRLFVPLPDRGGRLASLPSAEIQADRASGARATAAKRVRIVAEPVAMIRAAPSRKALPTPAVPASARSKTRNSADPRAPPTPPRRPSNRSAAPLNGLLSTGRASYALIARQRGL